MECTCWHCGKQITDLPIPLPFREICPRCHAYLHCCKNCRNYEPGRANDCKIPGTDPISDREARNSCDEFTLLGKAHPPKTNLQDAFNKLFDD